MPRQSSSTAKTTSKTKTQSKTAKTPKQPPTNTLGLSDLHLRYAGLEKEHQKLLKQIKSKRTEIDKLMTQGREIIQELAVKSMPIMQQVMEIDGHIHELFKDILTNRKLGKQTRKDIESIYWSLQRSGIISPNLDEEEDEEDPEFDAEFNFGDGDRGAYYDRNDEEEESDKYRSFRDLFNAAPKLDRDEQKKIRHIFLRLAGIFHPDKCLDHERSEHFAEIMKEVNQAYADGDLAKLLAIEKQHQLGQEIDLNSEDSLERNCDRLEQHNILLKNQYTNLKTELREIKYSHEGSMVIEFRQLVKQGINPIDELLSETNKKLDLALEIQDFVESFHQKRMTIKEFVRGPAVFQQMQMLTLEDLFNQAGFTIFDDEDDW